MDFICNVCGAPCAIPRQGLSRETESCAECGSSVRLRSLLALMSQEMFGVRITLPEFPVLKGIRGIGMSDSPDLAQRLAEKFDYTNTFYHQAPRLDVTDPDERDFERYDFILSSEVMEHVPPPAERSFAALFSMLKPDGVLLLTTPYNLGGKTAEHFPELYEYTLASPGGRIVLVNRRRDGAMEVFEDLMFHGGPGSTLEMRAFTEESLRELFRDTGFREVHFATENWPPHGIENLGEWSLPMAVRKGRFQPPTTELVIQYMEAFRLADRTKKHLARVEADYQRHIAFHKLADEEWKCEQLKNLDWIKRVEGDWQKRTEWALDSERERKKAVAEFRRVEASEAEAWKHVETLQAKIAAIEGRRWFQWGRKLGKI